MCVEEQNRFCHPLFVAPYKRSFLHASWIVETIGGGSSGRERVCMKHEEARGTQNFKGRREYENEKYKR